MTSEQILTQLLMMGISFEIAMTHALKNHNKVHSIEEVITNIYG
jgi:hypothetical protein